jgi:putative hemolysin
MTNVIIFEILLITGLILLNGALSLAEMAIVSSKKLRLQSLAENGNSGAKTAIALAENPSSFLASIQIGITLVAILTGVFGGATIADEIGKMVATVSWLVPYSEGIGLGIVVVVVTFLSLVFGELVPKRVALGNAERVAAFMAPPIHLVSIVARPAVRVLTASTEATIKLLGIKASDDQAVTEEEVKGMIDQGTQSGAFAKAEGSMMKRVLSFGDRRVGELMTQRIQMVALDIDAPFQENIAKIMAAPHTYFPVYQDTTDHLIGVVSNKSILDCMIRKQSLVVEIRECLWEPLFVSERMATLNLLEKFKETRKHLALVVDEYGSTVGIITLTDLMEAIVGDLPAEQEDDGTGVTRREDGTLLIDGLFPIYELTELLNTEDPHDDVEGDFQTLGGFVMHRLGKIPREGDQFTWEGYRFEVMDMDRHRVDKILVSPIV